MKGQMRVYYDEEGDFLEIRVGAPRANYGNHVNDDIVIFRDEKTDEAVGIGILITDMLSSLRFLFHTEQSNGKNNSHI